MSLRAKEDTLSIMKLVSVFHQEEWIQHCAAYFFVGDHPYTFHVNFEVSMEPSFSGDKYRIVKVLAVPLKGENEAFNLLPTLNTAARGSIVLLTYFRFPIRKSLNMTAFMESTTGFRSYLYMVLSCGLQVTYANCLVRAFRHYIKKSCTTFQNVNVPTWRILWLILGYFVKYFWKFFVYFFTCTQTYACTHTHTLFSYVHARFV